MNCKEKGSFYTPEELASWMTRRLLGNPIFADQKKIKILEPSSGDGVFFKTILACSNDLNMNVAIDAVEFSQSAAEESQQSFKKVKVFNEDFLFWEAKKKYDIIIGNPPYIVKSKLTTAQAKRCKDIHTESGLNNREVANIWTSFVIKGSQLLTSTGVLGFVLPTELLQVNYAKEIRSLLLKTFKRVEVISFRNLAFDKIEQDTVLLLAYMTSEEPGLYFSEATEVSELKKKTINLVKKGTENSELKWSSFVLNDEELSFIESIVNRCHKVSEISESVAGIVTAANNYFIVNQRDAEEFSLEPFTKPIIQKGMFVNGSAELTDEDYRILADEGKPCHVIDLTGVPKNKFTKGLKSYLEIGLEQKIHERYKCKLRKRWHDVPSIWKSEGFFFKRGHNYPKLLVNNADVHVTDAAYRIRMKQGYDINQFAMSFYNSLTLLCAELYGRYYGGGVLELTPNEFKKLPIPYVPSEFIGYADFINEFKTKRSIEDFAYKNDKKVLLDGINISFKEMERVQELYIKTRNRRLRSFE